MYDLLGYRVRSHAHITKEEDFQLILTTRFE